MYLKTYFVMKGFLAMRSLFLPFFLIFLFAKVGWSFLRMFGLFLSTVAGSLLSVFLFLGAIPLFLHNLAMPLTQAQAHYLQSNTFQNYKILLVALAQENYSAAATTITQQSEFLTPEVKSALLTSIKKSPQVLQTTQHWQEVLQLQPTDRDTLMNLSRLYHWQGEDMLSAKYFEKARDVDPNYQY